MSLYGWVIIGTIAGPFFLSFDKKVHFYTHWKTALPAIFCIGLLFIAWDEYFTQHSVWGFTDQYIGSIKIGHLPLEEVLFFLVVPYACVFVYEVLIAYFPKVNLTRITQSFAFAITLSGLVFSLFNLEKWYTLSASSIAALLTIGFFYIRKVTWYASFVFTFLVCIIPFLLVNGILTGSVTDLPVVWYNSDHILGARIITIPLEDLYYNYCMLLPIIGIHNWLKNRNSRSIKID
jgi:lycopene cyclase domain-containing protein